MGTTCKGIKTFVFPRFSSKTQKACESKNRSTPPYVSECIVFFFCISFPHNPNKIGEIPYHSRWPPNSVTNWKGVPITPGHLPQNRRVCFGCCCNCRSTASCDTILFHFFFTFLTVIVSWQFQLSIVGTSQFPFG